MVEPHILLPGARPLLTSAFRLGQSKPDFSDHIRGWNVGRELPLETVDSLIAEAVRKHPGDPAGSDRWLAPRLHAALRLRRSEAAERGFWAWLAVDRHDDYVRWRFPGNTEHEDIERRGTPVKRFMGRDRDHALARLWWGAELFRDGSDYTPVVKAFQMQDIPNTWLSLNAVHNPAAAQAALRSLPTLSSDGINDLSRALDHVLTTIQLDVVAPVGLPDVIAIDEWVESTSELEELIADTLPDGPDEASVEASEIEAVESLLQHVAAVVGLKLPVKSDTTTAP